MVCRIGACVCALPIEHVAEIMRPLPIDPLRELPSFVLGLSIIHGTPTPVVHAGALIGREGVAPGRFVLLRAITRSVALAVDEVLGIRRIEPSARAELPPLVQIASADAIERVGQLDAQLLLVLNAGRVLPNSVLVAIDAAVRG